MQHPTHRVEKSVAQRRRPSSILLSCVVCLFFTFLISSSASAQPGQTVDEVIQQLDDRFEISRTPEGWEFKPKWDPDTVSLIEVRNRRVYIKDRLVPFTELRTLIGLDDTERVFFIASGGPVVDTVDTSGTIETSRNSAKTPRPIVSESSPSREEIPAWLHYQIRRVLLRVPSPNRLDVLSGLEQLEDLRRVIDEEVCSTTHHVGAHELSTGLVLCSDVEFGFLRRSDIHVVGGDLKVSGTLAGQGVVVLGNATVSGSVQGDLLIVGGALEIEVGAKVVGDVFLVSGTVKSFPEGALEGTLHQLEFHEVMAGSAW